MGFDLGAFKRRINFILTALRLRRKGFFTPYDYLNSIDDPIEPYAAIDTLFRAREDSYSIFLDHMAQHEQRYIDSATGDIRPNWESTFISRLDGAAIYTAIVLFNPRRVIEIGSGNSTFFIARAIMDHGLTTDVTCIDPAPRIEISSLPVQFDARALDHTHIEQIKTLEANDILFVDSSHILQPEFDVDIILNRILPELRKGVIVHFHDIFLPFPYPPAWKPYRFNEQNALIPWLLSQRLEPIFASYYIWRNMNAQLRAICRQFPLDSEHNGGSLWARVL